MPADNLEIIGFVPIIKGRPGFITPVFVRDNKHYVQDLTSNGVELLEIALDGRIEAMPRHVQVTDKGEAIFGFQIDDRRCIFGERATLASKLHKIAERFTDRPRLYESIARFLSLAPAVTPVKEIGLVWTEERIALLRRLWGEGLPASQIAKQIGGVTRNNVIGKVHRLGLAGRATPSRPSKRPIRAARPRLTTSRGEAPTVVVPNLEPLGPSDKIQTLKFDETMCKYPIGDPLDANFSFCGRGVKEGPYCEEHSRLAYQPNTPMPLRVSVQDIQEATAGIDVTGKSKKRARADSVSGKK